VTPGAVARRRTSWREGLTWVCAACPAGALETGPSPGRPRRDWQADSGCVRQECSGTPVMRQNRYSSSSRMTRCPTDVHTSSLITGSAAYRGYYCQLLSADAPSVQVPGKHGPTQHGRGIRRCVPGAPHARLQRADQDSSLAAASRRLAARRGKHHGQASRGPCADGPCLCEPHPSCTVWEYGAMHVTSGYGRIRWIGVPRGPRVAVCAYPPHRCRPLPCAVWPTLPFFSYTPRGERAMLGRT
jgi:hypothetical protein